MTRAMSRRTVVRAAAAGLLAAALALGLVYAALREAPGRAPSTPGIGPGLPGAELAGNLGAVGAVGVGASGAGVDPAEVDLEQAATLGPPEDDEVPDGPPPGEDSLAEQGLRAAVAHCLEAARRRGEPLEVPLSVALRRHAGHGRPVGAAVGARATPRMRRCLQAALDEADVAAQGPDGEVTLTITLGPAPLPQVPEERSMRSAARARESSPQGATPPERGDEGPPLWEEEERPGAEAGLRP